MEQITRDPDALLNVQRLACAAADSAPDVAALAVALAAMRKPILFVAESTPVDVVAALIGSMPAPLVGLLVRFMRWLPDGAVYAADGATMDSVGEVRIWNGRELREVA